MNEWQSKPPQEENYRQQERVWESPNPTVWASKGLCLRAVGKQQTTCLILKGACYSRARTASDHTLQKSWWIQPKELGSGSPLALKTSVYLSIKWGLPFQLFQSWSQDIMDTASAVYKPKRAGTKSGRQWHGRGVPQGEPAGEHFLSGNVHWGLPGILEKGILIHIDVCRGARD